MSAVRLTIVVSSQRNSPLSKEKKGKKKETLSYLLVFWWVLVQLQGLWVVWDTQGHSFPIFQPLQCDCRCRPPLLSTMAEKQGVKSQFKRLCIKKTIFQGTPTVSYCSLGTEFRKIGFCCTPFSCS